MADDGLIEAAGRIADGEVVDWGSVSSTLKSDHAREVADELALLARIAAGHRQLHEILPLADETTANVVLDRARWGHLDLLNIVGRGSYGTVYRAWDTRLERLVALKLFHGAQDPDAVMQEGRMLARVRHENVVTVYGADVFDGVAGLWMELIHGRTLDQIVKDKGPMDPRDAAQIGVDVARALEAVHAAGLLHCDIKAQNVVRESGGRVVLMDLGAGRVVPEARDSDQLSDVAGTPRYMAPELFQAGADATKATDIYSFGVLLYYLVSARFPVDGKSLGELKRAHLFGRATALKEVRPDVPAPYASVVSRALDRDPAKRQPGATEVQSALEAILTPKPKPVTLRSIGVWVAAGVAAGLLAFAVIRQQVVRPLTVSTPAIQSIAVLPIKNLTGDPAKAYIADGLTEVLISNLARVRMLRVPSLSAVAPFRNTADSDNEVAKKLGVHLLLAGSVTRADSTVHLVVRLIDAQANTVPWGEDIESDMSGVLAAQAQLARMVANRLSLTLTPSEQNALSPRTVDPDAQDAYLHGLALDSAGPARSSEAGQYFRRAVEIDPTFAPAWAQLALNESRMIQQSVQDKGPRANLARQIAERAISLDPASGDGYAALGSIEFYHDWNFAKAEQTFNQALKVEPSHAFARQRLAMLLAARGRLTEAITLAREAQVLEPTDPRRSTSLGGIYYYARDFDNARRETERALSISPDFPVAHFELGLIEAALGHYDQAAVNMTRSLTPGRPQAYLINLARVYAAAGRTDDKAKVLDEALRRQQAGEAISEDNLAYIAAAEGRFDEAFRLLDQAVDQRLTDVLWMLVDPRVDPLRSDPRFDRLLSRAGLRP